MLMIIATNIVNDTNKTMTDIDNGNDNFYMILKMVQNQFYVPFPVYKTKIRNVRDSF